MYLQNKKMARKKELKKNKNLYLSFLGFVYITAGQFFLNSTSGFNFERGFELERGSFFDSLENNELSLPKQFSESNLADLSLFDNMNKNYSEFGIGTKPTDLLLDENAFDDESLFLGGSKNESEGSKNSDFNLINRSEIEVARFIVDIISEQAFATEQYEDFIIERVVRGNFSKIISSFLSEYKNSDYVEPEDFVISYLEGLARWRETGVEMPPLTEEQSRALRARLSKVLTGGLSKGAFSRTVKFLSGLFTDLLKPGKYTNAKNRNLPISEISKKCKSFTNAIKKLENATKDNEMKRAFAYGVVRDYLVKFFEYVSLKTKQDNMAFIVDQGLLQLIECCKQFCGYVDNLSYVANISDAKITKLNQGFALYESFIAAFVSIVNTLLTKVGNVDLRLVDKTTQKGLYEFLEKAKENNREKGIKDGRTFLDIATCFYAFSTGKPLDGELLKDVGLTELELKNLADKGSFKQEVTKVDHVDGAKTGKVDYSNDVVEAKFTDPTKDSKTKVDGVLDEVKVKPAKKLKVRSTEGDIDGAVYKENVNSIKDSYKDNSMVKTIIDNSARGVADELVADTNFAKGMDFAKRPYNSETALLYFKDLFKEYDRSTNPFKYKNAPEAGKTWLTFKKGDSVPVVIDRAVYNIACALTTEQLDDYKHVEKLGANFDRITADLEFISKGEGSTSKVNVEFLDALKKSKNLIVALASSLENFKFPEDVKKLGNYEETYEQWLFKIASLFDNASDEDMSVFNFVSILQEKNLFKLESGDSSTTDHEFEYMSSGEKEKLKIKGWLAKKKKIEPLHVDKAVYGVLEKTVKERLTGFFDAIFSLRKLFLQAKSKVKNYEDVVIANSAMVMSNMFTDATKDLNGVLEDEDNKDKRVFSYFFGISENFDKNLLLYKRGIDKKPGDTGIDVKRSGQGLVPAKIDSIVFKLAAAMGAPNCAPNEAELKKGFESILDIFTKIKAATSTAGGEYKYISERIDEKFIGLLKQSESFFVDLAGALQKFKSGTPGSFYKSYLLFFEAVNKAFDNAIKSDDKLEFLNYLSGKSADELLCVGDSSIDNIKFDRAEYAGLAKEKDVNFSSIFNAEITIVKQADVPKLKKSVKYTVAGLLRFFIEAIEELRSLFLEKTPCGEICRVAANKMMNGGISTSAEIYDASGAAVTSGDYNVDKDGSGSVLLLFKRIVEPGGAKDKLAYAKDIKRKLSYGDYFTDAGRAIKGKSAVSYKAGDKPKKDVESIVYNLALALCEDVTGFDWNKMSKRFDQIINIISLIKEKGNKNNKISEDFIKSLKKAKFLLINLAGSLRYFNLTCFSDFEHSYAPWASKLLSILINALPAEKEFIDMLSKDSISNLLNIDYNDKTSLGKSLPNFNAKNADKNGPDNVDAWKAQKNNLAQAGNKLTLLDISNERILSGFVKSIKMLGELFRSGADLKPELCDVFAPHSILAFGTELEIDDPKNKAKIGVSSDIEKGAYKYFYTIDRAFRNINDEKLFIKNDIANRQFAAATKKEVRKKDLEISENKAEFEYNWDIIAFRCAELLANDTFTFKADDVKELEANFDSFIATLKTLYAYCTNALGFNKEFIDKLKAAKPLFVGIANSFSKFAETKGAKYDDVYQNWLKEVAKVFATVDPKALDFISYEKGVDAESLISVPKSLGNAKFELRNLPYRKDYFTNLGLTNGTNIGFEQWYSMSGNVSGKKLSKFSFDINGTKFGDGIDIGGFFQRFFYCVNGIRKLFTKTSGSDNANKIFYENSSNVDASELTDEKGLATFQSITKYGNILPYLKQFYDEKGKLIYTSDVDPATLNYCQDLHGAPIKPTGDEALCHLERAAYCLGVVLGGAHFKDDEFAKIYIDYKFNGLIDAFEKMLDWKKAGHIRMKMDETFVEGLKNAKDFIVEFVHSLRKFKTVKDANEFEKTHDDWAFEVIRILRSVDVKLLQFLVDSPKDIVSDLLNADYKKTRFGSALNHKFKYSNDGSNEDIDVWTAKPVDLQSLSGEEIFKGTVADLLSLFAEGVNSLRLALSTPKGGGLVKKEFKQIVSEEDFYNGLANLIEKSVYFEDIDSIYKQEENLEKTVFDPLEKTSIYAQLKAKNAHYDFNDLVSTSLNVNYQSTKLEGLDDLLAGQETILGKETNVKEGDPDPFGPATGVAQFKAMFEVPFGYGDNGLVGSQTYTLQDLIGNICFAKNIPCSFSNFENLDQNNIDKDVFFQAMNVLAATSDDIKTVDELLEIYESAQGVHVFAKRKAALKKVGKVFGDKSGPRYKDLIRKSGVDKRIRIKNNKFKYLKNLNSNIYTDGTISDQFFDRAFDNSDIVYSESSKGFAEDRAKAERIRLQNEFDRQRRKRLKKNKEQELLQKQKNSLDALVDVVNEVTDKYNLLYKDNVVSNQKMSEVANLLSRESEVNSQTGANEGNVIYLDQSMTDALDVDNLRFNYNDHKTPSYNIILDEFDDDLSTGLAYKSLNKVPSGLVSPKAAENIKKGYF